jgi:chitodextrinase
MWGAAPRHSRVVVLLGVFAVLVLGSVRSAAGAPPSLNWAANPSVDFDGDHETDLGAIYRGRSPQDSLWYAPSSSGRTAFQIYFGATGDTPVPGDYDGDGKTDAVIYRPSTGLWYGPRTGAAQIVIQIILGVPGDIPIPGDYNGDGKTDAAIYRPSTGLFFAVFSGGGGTASAMFGDSDDLPVPADYDGDGTTDFAIYRPNVQGTTALWHAQLSGGGVYDAYWGAGSDVPVPADYNGDKRADPITFRPSTGLWSGPFNGAAGALQYTLGQIGDIPIPGYYDKDRAADPTIYRPSTGLWFSAYSGSGSQTISGLGVSTDAAAQKRPGPGSAPNDKKAPTTPANFSAQAATATSITTSWSASTDNRGVSSYRTYRNGTATANGTWITYTFTGLTCGTSYTLAVDAVDVAGNRSGKATLTGSTSACSIPGADTSPPTAPSNLAATSTTASSITLGWSASTDNVGVAGYGRYSNGTRLSDGTGTTYTFSGLTCGKSYVLAVDAYDAAGNRSATTQIAASTSACSADTTPPSNPTNQQIGPVSQTSITMTWGAATDNVGVAGYRAFLNSVVSGTTTTLSYTYTGLTCGTTYTLALEAFDAAGNVSNRAEASGPAATAACTGGGDTQPPSAPSGLVVSGAGQTSISLSWNASVDNVGVAGYGIYNGATRIGSSTLPTYTMSGLNCATTYTLGVDAFDSAANRSTKTSITTTTSACSPPPPPSGPVANLWVDTSGGSCVRSSTPGSYNDTAACSWQQANAACQGGDTVLVKGGSYGDVVIRGSNGRTSACSFTTTSGETVVVGSLELGTWNSCSPGANSPSTTNWITIVGPLKSREFHADCSNQVTVNGLDMDAGGQQITQPFQVQAGATNFTLRNSKVHNALNPNAMMVLQGSNFTIDNNDIYDDLNNTNGAIHDECLRTQPVQHMRLTRNHFWSCNVMDVFLTGDSGRNLATDWLVENNIFEPPTGSSGNAANAIFVRDGSDAYVVPDGFIVRYNTFGSTGMYVAPGNSTPTANGMQIYGNYFATNSPCGMPNTSYSFNITPTGVDNCGGAGAASFSASILNAGFLNNHPFSGNGGGTAEPAGDYRLVAGSPLLNQGNSGNYPSLDRTGAARFTGSAPDIGAYESG